MSCPKCNSDQIEHEGKGNLYARTVEFEFFVCRECGTKFVKNPEVEGEKENRSIPTREDLLKKIRWQNEIEYARQDRVEDLLNLNPIPSPEYYNKLHEALTDKQSGPEEYETLLSGNSQLMDRLFALCCGSLFEMNPKPQSIADMFRLGEPSHLAELVLAVEIMTAYKKPEGFPINLDQFWSHGIATGLGAWFLAKAVEEPAPLRLFVIGLLHDLGRLLLFTQSPKIALDIYNESRKSGRPLSEVENEILDFDHGKIAATQLKRFKIETPLLETIQDHHNPLDCRNQTTWACIVHISDSLSYKLRLGSSVETTPPPFNGEAVRKLGLTKSQLSTVKNQVLGYLTEIQDALLKGKCPPVSNPR